MSTLRYALALTLLLLTLLLNGHAWADIAIVVAADSPLTTLDADMAARLFMKKTNTVQGQAFTPIDLPAAHPTRKQFYLRVLNRTPDYMLGYWTRLVFTGRGSPPERADGEEDLLYRLARHPHLIGYMNAEKVDQRAKIVLRIKD